MKPTIKTTCPHCKRVLTMAEIIDQWCIRCERATNEKDAA